MSVNKVILLGNVGQRPRGEVSRYRCGCCYFPLGLLQTVPIHWQTERKFLNVRSGIILSFGADWQKTAEKYVHKGDKLYVEGKIRTRSYDDQNRCKTLCNGDFCR